MDKIALNKNCRVLFIGDSITDVKFNRRKRFSIKGNDIYALQLKRIFKQYSKLVHVDIKGIASNRTYHLYDRLTTDCINLKPDLIIMLIGVNDAWENYVPQDYPPLLRPMEPHIREIYRRIKWELPHTQIIYLMPFMIDSVEQKLPFHKTLDEYRSILKDIALENGARVIDLQTVFDEAQKTIPPCDLAIDGIHPTNLGHKIIAEAIQNELLLK